MSNHALHISVSSDQAGADFGGVIVVESGLVAWMSTRLLGSEPGIVKLVHTDLQSID